MTLGEAWLTMLRACYNFAIRSVSAALSEPLRVLICAVEMVTGLVQFVVA